MASLLTGSDSESYVRGPRLGQSPRASALSWTMLGACTIALIALLPLWVPLLLAGWTALVVNPLHARLVSRFGQSRSAGVVTVVLFALVLSPLIVIALSVVGSSLELARKLQASSTGVQGVRSVLASETAFQWHGGFSVRDAFEMVRRHGAEALSAASTVFGAMTAMVVGLVVFIFGLYSFLVHGAKLHVWLLRNCPLEQRHTERLVSVFIETGKGLFIGIGLTALLQAAVATVGYTLIGVPQPMVLGLLTLLAALVPSVGTGLVWVPVTIGLFVVGRTGAGIAVLVLGCAVSVVDNFVRPALSRYGRLNMPIFAVFVAMLGGIVAFGAWGLLAGPLFTRFAMEALAMWREEQEPTRLIQ